MVGKLAEQYGNNPTNQKYDYGRDEARYKTGHTCP